MNALTRDLVNLVNTAEENQTAKEQTSGTQFREKLHLMPPVGWLNDFVRWMVCSTHFSSTPHLTPKAV